MIEFNLDLLSVGITAAGIGLLGFTVFFNNTKSATNRIFLIFSLITIVWSIANYFQYQPSSHEVGLWTVRVITFLGCWHAFSFFLLCYVFPETELHMRTFLLGGITVIVGLTSILTLSPLVFQNVREASDGVVTQIQNGPLIPIFGMLVVILIGLGIVILGRKAYKGSGLIRKQIAVMGLGTFITFVCILTFNLILPSVYDNARFLPLSALFIFPFIACTGYAIFRYRMLNIKVLATEVVAFMLSIATLAQILFSANATELLFDTSVFALVLAFSILMVRSVIQEVHQREVIQAQATELTAANQQQESLLHFISHEVKGYLAKNEAAFAAITDGDYGVIEPQLKSMAGLALADTRKGVATVMDILDASNLKKGTVTYNKKPFDIGKALSESVASLVSAAAEKGIALEFTEPNMPFVVNGDESKIRDNVLRNVVDNSIKYTQKGNVRVEIASVDGKVRITVSDTGVGITPEDMQHLFTAGGHGKDSIHVNVHSTGYGLYIAKSVLEAHGGSIKAESEGAGCGSRFTIEVPLST